MSDEVAVVALATAIHSFNRERTHGCGGTHLMGYGECQWGATAVLAALRADPAAARSVAAALLTEEMLAEVLPGLLNFRAWLVPRSVADPSWRVLAAELRRALRDEP